MRLKLFSFHLKLGADLLFSFADTADYRRVLECARVGLLEGLLNLSPIINRCPELSDLTVIPSVSFKEGFGGVDITSSRGVDDAVDLEASGSGTRRRITLATWEWTRGLLAREDESQSQAVILAYDEPDTHLDYGHQRDLVDLVRSQCEIPGVRVIMATHSLNLIDKVPIDDVVHLDLEAQRTVVKRLFSDESAAVDQHLADIATSMGLRNSVLLHERCFIGVEGVTEQQAIPILFRVATGMTLQSAGLALVPAGGNIGARAFCQYFVEQGREVRFIIDRDSTAQYVFGAEKLRASGIADAQMCLVGNPAEIEDIFSDDAWAAAANSLWPKDDDTQWRADDFAALRTSGKFSARLHETVRAKSSEAPPTKSALLPALAGTLRAPHQVPTELREIFKDLIEIAGSR